MKKTLACLALGLVAGCLLADWLEAAFEVVKFLASYLIDCARTWFEEHGLELPFGGNGGTEV